jgi:hypothetical protein
MNYPLNLERTPQKTKSLLQVLVASASARASISPISRKATIPPSQITSQKWDCDAKRIAGVFLKLTPFHEFILQKVI